MSKKIIWAFDPFQLNPKVFARSVELLRYLAQKKFQPIEPVYVASPAEAKLNLEFSVPAERRYIEVAKRVFQKDFKKVAIKGLSSPRILFENHLRLSASAHTLAKYAKKQQAGLLVVGTQAKSGIGRFLLGSFAETLLYHSQTPVFLVSPNTQKIAPLKRILFPTDFSPQSKKALEQLAAAAKPLGAQVFIYHVIAEPFDWMVSAGDYFSGYGLLPPTEFIDIQCRKARRNAETWTQSLRRKKIKAEFILDKTNEGIADAVIRTAKKYRANAIALAAQSGPVAAGLLGSAARGVLRESKLPVWIYRSH